MARFDFRRRRRGPDRQIRFGLVVPAVEHVIWQNGVCVFDGVAEREREYRTNGRPTVIFEEDEAAEDDWRS